MRTQDSSFCLVASTLPVGFISNQIKSLRIKRIYVLSKEHQISYQKLKARNPEIKILRIPSSFILQSVWFLFILLQARFSKRRIIFFHECCLPIFDLLVCIVRPVGDYFPQVNMAVHEEIDPNSFPRNKTFLFLRLFRVVDLFKFYRFSPVGGGGSSGNAVSIRSYPETVLTHDVGYSRDVVFGGISYGEIKLNSLLFVTGKSFVADDEQREVLSELVSRAILMGYACEIKDHPNPNLRLNFSFDGAGVMDPHQPVELLDQNYRFVIGLSSTALVNFNDRAVSLLYLFDNMLEQDRSRCVRHFDSLFPGNKINYIHSILDFEELLKN